MENLKKNLQATTTDERIAAMFGFVEAMFDCGYSDTDGVLVCTLNELTPIDMDTMDTIISNRRELGRINHIPGRVDRSDDDAVITTMQVLEPYLTIAEKYKAITNDTYNSSIQFIKSVKPNNTERKKEIGESDE